jgi:hypothetical protein
VLLASFGLNGAALIAKDGRDFAGFYSLSHVEDRGGQIQATLIFRLYNYSGVDLKQAAVTVRETPPGARTLASFLPVPLWQDGTDVIIHREVTIPREEFQLWSGRGQPNVFIIYRDDSGREFQRRAQVSPRPVTIPDGDDATQ